MHILNALCRTYIHTSAFSLASDSLFPRSYIALRISAPIISYYVQYGYSGFPSSFDLHCCMCCSRFSSPAFPWVTYVTYTYSSLHRFACYTTISLVLSLVHILAGILLVICLYTTRTHDHTALIFILPHHISITSANSLASSDTSLFSKHLALRMKR